MERGLPAMRVLGTVAILSGLGASVTGWFVGFCRMCDVHASKAECLAETIGQSFHTTWVGLLVSTLGLLLITVLTACVQRRMASTRREAATLTNALALHRRVLRIDRGDIVLRPRVEPRTYREAR